MNIYKESISSIYFTRGGTKYHWSVFPFMEKEENGNRKYNDNKNIIKQNIS